MTNITEILAMMGQHLPLVVTGCVELLAAVAILGKSVGKQNKEGTKRQTFGREQEIIEELGNRKEEAVLVLKKEDLMPVYAGKNLENVTGLNFKKVQADVTNIWNMIKDPGTGKRYWEEYRRWDGRAPLKKEFEAVSGEWIELTIERSQSGTYDIFTFRVITSLHELLEEYKDKISHLEDESQSKTTFLSRMSHEIRTPMNGIIGMVTLAEGKLEKDHPATQYLEKVDELSEHLLSLINDILDMSRIEAGKVELEQQPFNIRELGDKLYSMFAKNLKERRIRYEVNFEDVTAQWLIGDELRLSQVIINFLSNAVKFTEQGEIIVTFRQMLKRDGIVDLMIRVHDTGIGMSTDFINRIFRPFEQEGIEISKKYGGTGLGMAITDQLVKLMGGEIVVESKEDAGSDFTIFLHLPEYQNSAAIGETARKTEVSKVAYSFQGSRILMAEDNEINALIAKEILEEMGASVDVVENGQQAVEYFDIHPQGYYDFILMDVQMPVMDGREATRTIRSLYRTDAKEIPIFALSADAFVEDERLSAESGMNGHFAKPIDFEVLQQKVGAFLMAKHQ